MSTFTRRAHVRTVNGRTVHVRESTVSRRGRDLQAQDARDADPATPPKKTYRRSTWVAATGVGVLMGGGKFATAGLPNAGGVIGLIGLVLLLVAAVMRVFRR